MILVEKLKDENPGGRCYAAEELGHIGDVSAIPYLIELLGDDHQEVRSSVARALGEIGHQSAEIFVRSSGICPGLGSICH